MAFEIAVKLLGDGSSFNRMLGDAKSRVSTFGSGMKSRLAAAFSVGAVAYAAKQQMAYADSVSDMSKKLGVGVKKIQEWGYAAKMSGTTLEAFGTSLKALAKSRDDALLDPGGEKAKFFKVLGIDEATLRNSPLDQLFEQIAETVRNTDFGADELTIVSEVLGKSGYELIPAFRDGLGEAAERARELGLVLEDSVVKTLADANDKLDESLERLNRASAKPAAAAMNAVSSVLEDAQASDGTYSLFGRANARWQAIKGLGWKALNPFAAIKATDEATKQYEAKVQAASDKGVAQSVLEPPELDGTRRVVRNPLAALAKTSKSKLDDFKLEAFKPMADSLAQIGGFVGTAGNPQMDAMQRGMDELVRWARTQSQTTEKLLEEVRALTGTVARSGW